MQHEENVKTNYIFDILKRLHEICQYKENSSVGEDGEGKSTILAMFLSFNT